jgi:KUP system potassium uptake protein
MLTWRKGNQLVEAARVSLRQPEGEFLEQLRRAPPIVLPGNAAFLSSATSAIPLHLSRFVERSHALHKRILIVTARYEEEPSLPRDQRAEVVVITPDIIRVILRYGFMEDASVPDGLRCAVESERLPPEWLEDLTIFIGHETIIPKSDQRGMATWREEIYAFLLRNAERTGAHFCVPTRQLVEVGTEIEI